MGELGSLHRQAGQRRGILTTSRAHGPTTPPLLPQTIPAHFSSIVSAHGDRPAVISHAQSTTLSYRELDERSTVLAHALRERGVKKGDRCAVMLGNGWEFAVGTYGVWKVGGVLVPLNPAFTAPQVTSALTHLSASHLIISTETNLPYKPPRENVSLLQQIIPDLTASQISSEAVPSLRNVILVDNSDGRVGTSKLGATVAFADLMGDWERMKGESVVLEEPLHGDDIINIQFTSGTTSTPKAACLTHTSILNNGFSIGSRMGLTPSDIICCPPPLFHCFGSILGYMASATHGSAILFPSESFSPLATLQSIQQHRATALYGVATMFVAELELLSNGTVRNEGFEHLRTGIAAGSSVPAALMEKLHDKLNLTGLTICYGMTETSPVSCMTTPDDPLEKRLDSVGRLLPHVEAKIVSTTDRDEVLPIGERGELVISGYNVMTGYWGDKTRTDEVRIVEIDENGKRKVWMHTGDEASMDASGYVKITGRIKDLIIRGGENIHPLEIENIIFKHPFVSEVSVVGIPDPKYGEVVAAFVVVHSGVEVGVDDRGVGEEYVDHMCEQIRNSVGRKSLRREDVRSWVRQGLSGHLVPKYVFWVGEEGYPKTASGKIQKFRLREMAVGWLGERGEEEKKGV